MKVLVVGSGGREHALAWKLAQSSLVTQVLIAPGNAGTAEVGENVPVGADDIDALLALARDRAIDLTVVGPEAPLVAGLADAMRGAGLAVFGPSAAAARIEGSKSWAKRLMQDYGIPTARARTFDASGPALEYVASLPDASYVIKFDGLAAGKGVLLPETRDEARNAIVSMLDENAFGSDGSSLLVEERLTGPEVSVFAFVHGDYVSAEVAACDYKRAGDGDTGPNTGGMGSYTPPEFWTPELARAVREEILKPVARAMAAEGSPYSGVLFAGLMLTADGPKVIEFNCRFGDPECEVIMARLQSDIFAACLAIAEGRTEDVDLDWGRSAQVGVVMASGGYPVKYQTGMPITGLADAAEVSTVFHSGTALDAGRGLVTAGGRVLVAVGGGEDVERARAAAYKGINRIRFDRAIYREDIAVRAIEAAARAG